MSRRGTKRWGEPVYENLEDTDDSGRYDGRGSRPFKSVRPTPTELKEDQTALLAAKRTINPHADLSSADKALRSVLNVYHKRAGTNVIPGDPSPPYPQVPVVGTVEVRAEDERLLRLSRPKEERMGPIGRVNSFQILPGTIAFAREKDFRTAPQGYPDVQAFSNLAGLSISEDRLVVLGVFIIPQEASEQKDTTATISYTGGGLRIPHTGAVPIPAWSRVIALNRPLVTLTDEGEAQPYHRVQGHDEMTQYPNLAPFYDTDIAVKAAEVDTLLHDLFEQMVFGSDDDNEEKKDEEGDPVISIAKQEELDVREFLIKAEEAAKAKVFNDDGYDPDSKHPIEFYANWAALEIALNATYLKMHTGSLKETWGVLRARMAELLDAENDHPDFQRFMEAYGDDIDHTGEDEIRAIIQKDEAPKARGLFRLWKAVKQQKNTSLMEHHAFVMRRTVGTAMSSMQPGMGYIDLLR